MVLEVEASYRRVGWYRVDALLAPGAEEQERRIPVELWIVELRDRRRAHEVAPVDEDRVVVSGLHVPMPRDVLVEPHVHDAVLLQGVHLAGLDLAWLQPAQRLGDRHLEDDDLTLAQRRLRDAMARLDERRRVRARRRAHSGSPLEELPDADGVGGVVGALVDHFEDVIWPDDARRHLDAAGTPSVRERHLAAPERDLMAGDRHGLQERTADHPLRLLVEEREVVATHRARASASDRSLRISTSSDWKSTWWGSFKCWTKPEASTLSLCDRTNSSSCGGEVGASPSSRQRNARSTSAIVIALRSVCPKVNPYPRVNCGGAVADPLNWFTIWHSVSVISPIVIGNPSSSGTSSTSTSPTRISPAKGWFRP